ncbi:MAG: hypothetical protein ACUVRS_08960 [Armatimonadota bacterium]
MFAVRLLGNRLLWLIQFVFDQRNPLRFWVAVAATCGLVLIIIGSLVRPHKIDANNTLSPWDQSVAPPAYVSPEKVGVVDKRSVSLPGSERQAQKMLQSSNLPGSGSRMQSSGLRSKADDS